MTRSPLLPLLFLLACHSADTGSPEISPKHTAPAKAAELATTVVKVRRPTGTLRLAGELRAWQQVALHARLSAYVRERRVDVGDRVTEGDVLVVLSAPDRLAERAEAEAELASAQTRLRRLEAAAAREGAVAPLELEDARGTATALEARVRALRELERELTVRAPFAGVVTQRGADDGALVGPGAAEALVSVADLSRLRLVVAVPERFTRAAVPGAHIPFRLEGDKPEQAREAVVSRTSRSLDPATRTLHVELDVENANGALLAGSYVEVLWPLDTGDELPWVPAAAVVHSSEGTWVWVRRGDSLVKVVVDELVRETGFVAVRAPLIEGDVIVSRGSEDLTEGPWPAATAR